MSQAATTETDPHASTLTNLALAVGEGAFEVVRGAHDLRVHAASGRVVDVLRALKERCGFNFLVELGGVDYLGYPGRTGPRFEVHYALLNHETTERVVVKAGVDDPDPTLPTAVPLWAGADWMEREVFDMYGIRFEGHPDPRRILMPEEFTAFPLRKDYPLRGRGERHNYEKIHRDDS